MNPVRRGWHRFTDALLLARLRLYDWIAGPLPEAEADRIREREAAAKVVDFPSANNAAKSKEFPPARG